LKALIESRKEVPKIHDLLELASEATKCGFDSQLRGWANTPDHLIAIESILDGIV